jgi:hypothetical protein
MLQRNMHCWPPHKGAPASQGAQTPPPTNLQKENNMNAITENTPSAAINPMLPLAGKKGLITGVANDKSIAFAVAKAVRALGADIAITYQNDKTAKYTQPLADALGAVSLKSSTSPSRAAWKASSKNAAPNSARSTSPFTRWPSVKPTTCTAASSTPPNPASIQR